MAELLPLIMNPFILDHSYVIFFSTGFIHLYFIFSSEIKENISVIKVVSIYSEMIWYHFTVD